MGNAGLKRGIGMTGPFPNIPGSAGATLLKAPTREGGIAWGATPLVDACAEFGIDTTGSVADNSARLNNALAIGAVGGFSLYLPPPPAGGPGVLNIQNPITLGSGTSTALSSIQGGRLVGAGWPGLYQMAASSPFQEGLTTLNWNGPSGGTMVEILGPLQGWGLENLYLYSPSGSAAAVGIDVLSGQFGAVRNVVVNGASGFLIKEECAGTGFGAAIANTMHNRWRNIGLVIPNGSIGWAFGLSTTVTNSNTCYEDIGEVLAVLPSSMSSTTIVFQFASADNCRIRNVHITGPGSGGSHANAIWIQTSSAQNSWPCDNFIENIDFGNIVAQSGAAYSKHGAGFGAGATPNIVRNVSKTNGNTPNPANVSGGQSNLVWDAPGQPTGVISGSPFTFTTTTAWTNVYGVPVTVYLTGGTITAVSIGGSSLGTGAAALSGPWRVPVNQTITFTGTGTITGDVIGD